MVKTVLLFLLGGLMLAVAVIALIAATRPDTFRVERSTRIAAAPERIYPLINDLRQMNGWNPFVMKDSAIQGQYRGPASGPGAGYDFQGNKDVGKGRIEIADAVAPSRVTMKLDMLEPFEGHNTVVFDLVPEGSATRVTWSMHGPSPFIGKVMGLIFNMDKMIGKEFDNGLAGLKAKAERV